MKITTKQEKIDLIETSFGESSLANSGKNVSVVCPVCKENSRASSKKKKLSICLEKGIYHCWVCESKGKNVASFAFKNAAIDNGIGDHGILDSKAAEVNSIPLTPPFKIVWLSKQVMITNPVSVQIITVSIKGSNNATYPSVIGDFVLTAE